MQTSATVPKADRYHETETFIIFIECFLRAKSVYSDSRYLQMLLILGKSSLLWKLLQKLRGDLIELQAMKIIEV